MNNLLSPSLALRAVAQKSWLLALTGLALLALPCAHATTRSYNGNSANNQWSVAANWVPVGVPQSGDVLVFGALAGNRNTVNDLANLKLDTIQITASGYEISGNSITLTNGLVAASATLLFIYNDLTLGQTQTFDVDGSSSVRLYSNINLNGFNLTIGSDSYFETHGSFSGTGNITKSGSGELLMAGSPNTFNGSITHFGGLFSVAKASCLTAGFFSYGATKLYSSGSTASDCDITLYPGASMMTSGANVTNTIRHLTLHGALMEDAQLRFVLRGNLTNLAWNTESRFFGHLDLQNTNHLFHINDGAAVNDLVLANGSLTGGTSAGFTKAGTGKLLCNFMSGAHGGTNHIVGGILEAGINANMLGTGRTVVYDGASIQTQPGSGLTSSFELSGNGVGGTNGAIRGFGVSQVTGSFLITGSATVRGDGALHLNGSIGGFGTLHIAGTNEVWTEGASANTLIGGYRVDSGTFVLNKPAGTTAVGSEIIVGSDGLFDLQPAALRNVANEQIVSHVTIATSGRYELNGHTETVPSLDLYNAARVEMAGGTLVLAGDLQVVPALFASSPATFDGSGTLNVGSGTRNIIVSESVAAGHGLRLDVISTTLTGSANILKQGNGGMRIGFNTSHTGTFTIEAGDVEVTALSPFGSSAPTVVTGPGALIMSGSAFSDTEPMTFNGTGRVDSATLVIKDSTSLRGALTLAQDTRVSVANGAVFTVNSPVVGAGGLIKEGSGEMRFDWDRTNTFTGGLWIKDGLVTMTRGDATNLTLASSITVGDGLGAAGSARLLATLRQQIVNTADVTLMSDGRFTVTNMNEVEIIRRLQGAGQVHIHGFGLRCNDGGLDSTFNGSISGTGDLFKAGAGKFTHSGNCNASGLTFSLFGGETAIDGVWNASPTPTLIEAWSGTVLSGQGTMQNVNIRSGATLSPGSSPGILTLNNLTMTNSANLFLELRGTTPGTQHDQIVARSSVNISNATLTLALNYPPVNGDVLRLVDNQGANPILGTFSGRPQGSIVTISGNQFVLSYTGGTGNDITLTATNARLDLLTATITSGNGLVDPGECNEVFLVLTNQSGGALSGVIATLDSRSPAIAVAQQTSAYPTFTANSTRTNTMAFRLSTLPGFVCGQRIELQLTVTAGGATFSVPVTLPSGTLGAPTSYGTTVPIPIPDLGTTNSTLNISTFPGSVSKVTVSFHITHTFDADLDIFLQSPSGQLVSLVADRGGSGDNFGTNCSPNSARTTVDDSSRNFFGTATAPFVGTFSPEEPLAGFVGETGNGAWKLIVTDDAASDTGTLNCWTLNLFASACTADSLSSCQPCTPTISGVLNAQSPTLSRRLVRDGNPSVCGETKLCPGETVGLLAYRYRTHTFTNTGASGCVTVVLLDPCGNASLLATAYSGGFNPSDLCAGYLADIGTNALSPAMSFYVPSNGVVTLMVNEILPGAGCGSYSLNVFGLPCPAPTLRIAPAPAGQMRLFWNAIGGSGYDLQTASVMAGATFTNAGVAPVYVNGTWNVTNSAAAAQRYFRLQKP